MERFNLMKLNVTEVIEQYQVKISNMIAALENLMWTSAGLGKVLEYESFSCRVSRLL
jgi:hypothetical protein